MLKIILFLPNNNNRTIILTEKGLNESERIKKE